MKFQECGLHIPDFFVKFLTFYEFDIVKIAKTVYNMMTML